MSIIHRYIVKEIFVYIFTVVFILSSLFILNDFFDKISELTRKGIPLLHGFYYVLFRVPFFIATILPVSVILSTLIVFSLMNKNRELVAIEGAGVSRFYITAAPLISGIIMSFLLFAIAEIVSPAALVKADNIIPTYKNITYNWIKSDRIITHVRYYEKAIKNISGLSVYYFDDNFNLIKRLDAKTCRFNEKKGLWHMKSVIIQDIKDNDESEVLYEEDVDDKLHFKPKDLGKIIRKRRAISSKELKEIIDKMESEGYDAVGYRVDYYSKFSVPAVCFLMALTASYIATHKKIIKSMPLSIVCGIFIWFIHWVSHSLFLSLGKGEIINPLISAWLSNFIFFFVLVYLLIKRRDAF